jgi:hypothetical protein
MDYAAQGLTVEDIGDLTLNLATADNRSVVAELSTLPPKLVGFGSDQMVKFAREIQLDTGSFAWLGAAEVQALGIFFCGMTTQI